MRSPGNPFRKARFAAACIAYLAKRSANTMVAQILGFDGTERAKSSESLAYCHGSRPEDRAVKDCQYRTASHASDSQLAARQAAIAASAMRPLLKSWNIVISSSASAPLGAPTGKR